MAKPKFLEPQKASKPSKPDTKSGPVSKPSSKSGPFKSPANKAKVKKGFY